MPDPQQPPTPAEPAPPAGGPRAVGTLDALYALLTTAPDTHATADAAGLPRSAHADAIDWTDLPTFGGAAPRATVGVWSWDATRLLVGSCAADLRLVPRAEEG